MCSICLSDNHNSVVKTDCGHHFHRCCIRQWLENHVSCPMCRNQVANERPEIDAVFGLDFYVTDVDEDIRMYAPNYNDLNDGMRDDGSHHGGSGDDDSDDDGSDNDGSDDDDPDYVLSDYDEDDDDN